MNDQLVYAMYQVGELRSRISDKTALIDQEMPAIVQTLAGAIEALIFDYADHIHTSGGASPLRRTW